MRYAVGQRQTGLPPQSAQRLVCKRQVRILEVLRASRSFGRHASLPVALYQEGYVRQGALSDKGFHYFESFPVLNHFSRDFLQW